MGRPATHSQAERLFGLPTSSAFWIKVISSSFGGVRLSWWGPVRYDAGQKRPQLFVAALRRVRVIVHIAV